jgi:uncharacterized protein YbaR (Trm112 family)
MSYKINKVELQEEFKICPLCHYSDGFHTMLKQDKDSIAQLLICPSCAQVYDVGLRHKT